MGSSDVLKTRFCANKKKRDEKKDTGGKKNVRARINVYKYRPLHLVSCIFNESSFMNVIEHITIRHILSLIQGHLSKKLHTSRDDCNLGGKKWS